MNSKYIFPAIVTRIVDADTIEVDFNLGFGIKFEDQSIRLFGINAYEIKKYKGVTEEQKARGLEGKDKVEQLCPVGSEVIIETYLKEKGKFGRLLGTIWVPSEMLFEDYTAVSTLVNQPRTKEIAGTVYNNLNYWLVTQDYAVEKEY